MTDILIELIHYMEDERLKLTAFFLLIAILLFAAAARYLKVWLTVPFLRRSYIGAVVSALWCIIVAGTAPLFLTVSWRWLFGFGLCFLVISVFAPIFIYVRRRHRLNVISRQANRDLIGAWKALKEIPVSQLTPGLKKRYRRRSLYLLLMLGSLGKAERMLEELGEKKTPLYYLFQGMKQLAAGDIPKASEEMKRAEECCFSGEEPEMDIQILMNRGALQVCLGNLREADFYYKQAVREAREQYERGRGRTGRSRAGRGQTGKNCKGRNRLEKRRKKMDFTIRETLYYNYCFNLCRLREETPEPGWREALEEYKSFLNMEDPEAFISCGNMELELLRQAEAPPEEIEALVRGQYEGIKRFPLSDEQRRVYKGSMARIVCTMRQNPEWCLAALEEERDGFLKLPMPARYRTMKELDLFFRDLRDDRLLEQYHDLDQMAETYMDHQAEQDIWAYLASLPPEAVYERCDFRKELAGVKRRDTERCEFEKIAGILEEAALVYEENELNIDAADARLAIMDEAIFPLNLDDFHKPEYPEVMYRQMEQVEALIGRMVLHPKRAECVLRLSYYCYHLDEYQKCILYFRQFEKAGFPLMHYAPWLRGYHDACRQIVPILEFAEAIGAARQDRPRLEACGKEITDWFDQFYHSDGVEAALLLGRFREQPVTLAKRRFFIREEEPFVHVWLFDPDIGLEVDLTYGQFQEEGKKACILFSMGRHPFETGQSLFLQKQRTDSGISFQGVQWAQIDEKGLPDSARAVLDAVYGLILEKMPQTARGGGVDR